MKRAGRLKTRRHEPGAWDSNSQGARITAGRKEWPAANVRSFAKFLS